MQVQCAVPATPNVSPTSVSIQVGQTASFTIANAADTLLYSIWDVYGNNYASSKFGSGGGTLSLPSYSFNTAGTYDLMVVADRLTGAGCYSTQSIKVTVEHSTLATKLLSLAAQKSGHQVKLEWKVSNEENIKQYKVERSVDGINFRPVITVPYHAFSGNVNTYTAIDNLSSPAAKLYYRIQLLTTSAASLYSHIASVEGVMDQAIQIMPNPAKGQAKLYVESSEEQSATAELMDMNGKVLMVKKIRLYEGANLMNVEGLERFAGGNYIMRVVTKAGKQHLRLVIQ
jgi:hypothetical protein